MKNFMIWTACSQVLIRSAESINQAVIQVRDEGYLVVNIKAQ